MDDAVTAVHDLLRRLATAETIVELLRAEWVELTHDEKIRLGKIAPDLIEVIVRIP